MLRSRSSARACSTRRAASASCALLREQRQEREDHRAADGDVERQHQAREPLRERRRDAQRRRREARGQEHGDECNEPADARPDALEDQRAERSHDPPDPDAAGREEAADRHHRERRRERDRRELDVAARAGSRGSGRTGGSSRARSPSTAARCCRSTPRGRGRAATRPARSAGSGARSGRAAPCGAASPRRRPDRRRPLRIALRMSSSKPRSVGTRTEDSRRRNIQ